MMPDFLLLCNSKYFLMQKGKQLVDGHEGAAGTRIRFSGGYFVCTLLLVGVEIFIGTRMHDRVIRPYGGDYLIVILLYCFFRSFLAAPSLARTLLGTSFTWTDM